jgi:type I restriction enzyme S subunit
MKPYPAYKPSGVSWIGAVPEHWVVNLLKRGFDVVLGKMLQSEQHSEEEQLASYLRSANVQWGKVDTSDIQKMWFSPHELRQLNLEPDDLVICEGGDAGRGAIWEGELEDCYFQNSVNRVRSSWGNSTRFLLYWLWSIKQAGFIEIICSKATIAHLTKEKLQALPMLYPPVDEQRAITAYLDHETARIDTLITEKEGLIDSLREYRQATISEVVTQGLNTAAPKKSSGVTWLGEVPIHWDLQRLRFRCKLNPCVREDLNNGDVVSFLPMEAVGDDGSLDLEATRLVGEVVKGYTYFEDGDVTIAKITPCFENGKGAVMRGLLGGVGFGTTELIVIRPSETVHPDWLYYLTQSHSFRKRGEATMYGAGGQKRVSDSFVKDFPIAWPPIEEQKAIAEYLVYETARIDKLIEHVQDEIKLLQELRAATITDAVTGKIQVS